MSLCPSSSHQLVAAAIAFRRARRKFPKDFGLESAVERGNPRESSAKEGTSPAKVETTTSHEGPINQARSSCSLVRRACSSRSDHVCPTSARCRDHDRSCSEESSIGCNCCRIRNVGEDVPELRNDCSGGDAVDTVPGRECDQSVVMSSANRKNEFAKLADRDRCDVMSRTANGEAVKTTECIPQFARSTFCHHRKARCSSKPCPSFDATKPLHDYAPRERNDKIACGDSSGDRSKEFALANYYETSVDPDDNAQEGDARGTAVNDWTSVNASRKHCRKSADSVCRYRCEYHDGSTADLSRGPCDNCRHHHDHHCCHWHCCYQQRDDSFMNASEYDASCGISGGKAQHKSWREQMRGDDGRLYARQRYSRNSREVIPAAREKNMRDESGNNNNNNDDDDEEEEDVGDDDDDDDDDDDEDDDEDDDDEDNIDEEDDDGVAIINHKDSMCILAEKYKAGRKGRAKKCAKDEHSKSQNVSRTLEIGDQTRGSPCEESASVKHVCRTHCEGCARVCGVSGRRHAPLEGEYDRSKCPLNGTRCCSSRAPCGRTF